MRPIFVENSRIPIWLSKLSPIEINAIVLFPFVFSKGKMGKYTRNHEIIHFEQYLETGVIGFLIIYLIDYLVGLFKYGNGEKAYVRIRAEQEAHDNDNNLNYLEERVRWEWLKKYEV